VHHHGLGLSAFAAPVLTKRRGPRQKRFWSEAEAGFGPGHPATGSVSSKSAEVGEIAHAELIEPNRAGQGARFTANHNLDIEFLNVHGSRRGETLSSLQHIRMEERKVAS